MEENKKNCCSREGCGCPLGVRTLQPEGSPPTKQAYSHGVLVPLPGADLLFTAGQIAKDAEGHIVGANDIVKQTETVFENIRKILSSAGMEFGDVIKAQIFLTREEDVPVVQGIRNKYFGANKPVSTMLVISQLVHPEYWVEIEVVAVRAHKKECRIGHFFKRLFGCKKESCCHSHTDGKAAAGQCCKDKN